MKHIITITVDDGIYNFSREQIKIMVKENMLHHVDNAPFIVENLEVSQIIEGFKKN